jgi:hypothetical protein
VTPCGLVRMIGGRRCYRATWCNTISLEALIEFIHVFRLTQPLLLKFYLPTDAQKSCFKRILKFTLKHVGAVSM